ncbi:MAG TPA: D-arabinono-1,4-lactone oxidase, partial [Allocoleopsis sp.]
YYFIPTNLTELKSVLAEAATVPGVTVRVSGQRHSQPPLVVDDNRDNVPQATKTYVVDMSCYKDLGPRQDQHIMLELGKNQITVNTGVREDELEAFLTKNNLMLKTVTAGGFFSVGGMTVVDVHGGTVDTPIFAETVSVFNILLANGTVMTIDAQSPVVDGWSPLQFVRVSLGCLGIVTSVTIDVLPRPYATTLQGGSKRYGIKDKSAFINQFQKPLTSHARLEIFFTPYATEYVESLGTKNFLALWWDVVNDPTQKIANQPPQPYPATACDLAGQPRPEYGAPNLGEVVEGVAQNVAVKAQYVKRSGNSPIGMFENGIYNPAVIAATAFDEIEKQVGKANASYSELWLTKAARVIFMSYYVPLPDLKAAGLGKVWDGLNVVARIVTQNDNFHIAAPMEFRFVKGGNSAMSGAYSDDPNAWFVNLDLIGFIDPNQKASDYPPKLLKFFADVEREWVNMGGFPHNGKIYGFYDPTDAPGTYSKTGPFNPNFLSHLRTRRGARLVAFNTYRKSLDPNGLFFNDYLCKLLES